MFMSIIISLGIGIVGVIIITRILGKKQLSQVTPIDFVYVLILGGIVEEGLYTTQTSWYHIAFTFVVWGLMVWTIETLTQRYDKFRNLIKGTNNVLVEDGKVNYKALRKNKLEIEQLRTLLRMQSIFSLKDVEYAVLETSGTVSVLEKAEGEPLSKADYLEDIDRNVPSFLLVENGEIHQKTLKRTPKDEEWLLKELSQKGVELKDIYFAEWDAKSGLFIQTYH
ncbi:DUF421 domain-containing protein [Salibacterium aidingense]|uniref:DUF421 domain-containing protein n=1 Tax=Salibacterium aidingense TaxID=384933 RepID=UPI003BC4EC81